MNKTKSIIILFFSLVIYGCSNKNYNQIIDIKKEYENNNDDNIILRSKDFKPNKKIFKKLKSDITDDFVYIFSWVNHLPIVGIDEYKSILYDKNTKKVYYINNTPENKKKIHITTENKNFKEEKKLLDGFLNEKIDSLVNLKPRYVSSEIGSDYYIFDSTSKKAFVIKNFTLR